MEEPSHPEFETGADDQPIVELSQHPEWFFQQQKPPTPDRDWNKTLPATHESIQPWISELTKKSDSRSSFNELMDTPVDFSNFLINRINVDTLTLELLAGPTYELLKGSCKSLVELKYHLEEVYKAKTDQLDWVNPEGQQYPRNLFKPLPMIPINRGRRVIPFDLFINNDLEYLRGGASSRKYTTSVTKTKATDYGHIKWIEDLFYSFAVNRESARDVYSKRRIIAVTELKIVERVEDLQLGVESYQKKLNLTKPNTYCFDLKRKEAYISYSNLRGFIYQNKDRKNRLMRIDELHKFSDGTLIDVRTALDDRLKGIRMQYLPQSVWRKSDKDRASVMIQAIDKRLKTRRIIRSLERSKSEYMGIVSTEMEIILEHTQQGISHEVLIFEMITLSMYYKTTLASDMLIDFQIKFSISIGEIVTHWFTLIALSALRRSDNENMLSLMNLILMSILMDLQVTPTKPGRMTKPYSSHRFIANYFNAGNLKMEVKDLGLNTCNHNIPLSSREVPSFDETKPQPHPLLNCPPLDVNQGDKRGTDPPIKPHSSDSFRMKVVEKLTINTPSSPHVASFHPKDIYCYYHPCVDDTEKYYGFKTGLSGQGGSIGVDLSNWEVLENSFLRGLSLPVKPNELEKGRIKKTHNLEHIIQQPLFQHKAHSYHNGVYH
uniref:MAK10-like protein n=1 Tax=Tanacetum cinerariifolium TaxID=118510 RepID=A0A6L2NQC9_TANCI|nr:hypothetical protein [Tanacetum cinerariifolium]